MGHPRVAYPQQLSTKIAGERASVQAGSFGTTLEYYSKQRKKRARMKVIVFGRVRQSSSFPKLHHGAVSNVLDPALHKKLKAGVGS
jgi:hypothetical protein